MSGYEDGLSNASACAAFTAAGRSSDSKVTKSTIQSRTEWKERVLADVMEFPLKGLSPFSMCSWGETSDLRLRFRVVGAALHLVQVFRYWMDLISHSQHAGQGQSIWKATRGPARERGPLSGAAPPPGRWKSGILGGESNDDGITAQCSQTSIDGWKSYRGLSSI